MTALILLKDFLETQIELWKPIPTNIALEGYEVSNLGRVRSFRKQVRDGTQRGGFHSILIAEPRYLKTRIGKNGFFPYPNVSLQTPRGERQLMVHLLVAKTFLSNPENLSEVNHLTAIKSDPRARNLEWCTHAQNQRHAVENVLYPRGSSQWKALLNDDLVRSIRQRVASGEKQAHVARELNVSRSTVHILIKGKTWRHVT